MIDLKKLEVWFITGSQHLYGEETLQQVAEHSTTIANYLNQSEEIPVSVVFKPVVKTAEEIFAVMQAANNEVNCIGIITWMHTFYDEAQCAVKTNIHVNLSIRSH